MYVHPILHVQRVSRRADLFFGVERQTERKPPNSFCKQLHLQTWPGDRLSQARRGNISPSTEHFGPKGDAEKRNTSCGWTKSCTAWKPNLQGIIQGFLGGPGFRPSAVGNPGNWPVVSFTTWPSSLHQVSILPFQVLTPHRCSNWPSAFPFYSVVQGVLLREQRWQRSMTRTKAQPVWFPGCSG